MKLLKTLSPIYLLSTAEAYMSCAYKYAGPYQITENFTPKDANDNTHTNGGVRSINKRLKMVQRQIFKSRKPQFRAGGAAAYGNSFNDEYEEMYYDYSDPDHEEYINYDDYDENDDYEEEYIDYNDESSIGDTVPRVIILLDSTDSMQNLVSPTVQSYNEFLTKNQKLEPGETHTPKFTKIDFAYWFKASTYNDIVNADTLTTSDYTPEGCTSLYDAIGCAIDQFSEEDGNILAVITDGEDTCSEMFQDYDIKRKIQQMENNKGWSFSFIGAKEIGNDENGYKNLASNLGFSAANTIGFNNDANGIRRMFKKVDRVVKKQRKFANTFAFNHSERRNKIARRMRLKAQNKQSNNQSDKSSQMDKYRQAIRNMGRRTPKI